MHYLPHSCFLLCFYRFRHPLLTGQQIQKKIQKRVLTFSFEIRFLLLFPQKLSENSVYHLAVSEPHTVHAVGLIQQRGQLRYIHVLPAKIQHNSPERHILFSIRIMHNVGRKQHQLPRLKHIELILKTLIPLSFFQIIQLIIIVIMGLGHIVIDPCNPLTGNLRPLRHHNSRLINHSPFSSAVSA